ncbi:methyltransferase domain-containing protein [Candidatus Cyanaurora vandensis]|uniref:methyltransferase domain-containing protein n=1 Tax=Candidatus Cyanaurora vandensis TaxID=2714958 RepID=UPI002579A5D9|nr:methyltransferase domain-containing protein [Candidatus Cyanaurora vandensis]
MSYAFLGGQRSMALDERRNRAYQQALAQVITAESVVLDLGAGLGVLGLLAAQLGAKRVYLVEPEDVLGVAADFVRTQGRQAQVVCRQGWIETTPLPEPVDVLVSVFTGNFLLEEDLLPLLFLARDRYLKPGGRMIPDRAVMVAVPVSAPRLHAEEVAIWSEPHLGLDLQAGRAYASQQIYYERKHLAQAQYLAQPLPLWELDLTTAQDTHCQVEVTYPITADGLCHGWCGWFDLRLGDWLSTSPKDPPLHWSAAFLPLDPPIAVTVGEEVTFRLVRPPQGCWSWEVQTTTTHRRHSTFLGLPLTPQTLHRSSLDHRPQRTVRGEAARFVLEHCDGKWTIQQLSAQLHHRYPDLFNPQQAVHYVQSLVKQYS